MSLLDSIGAALKGKGGEPGSKTYWPILIYATLMAMAFLTLVPIVWMVLTAFKSAPRSLQTLRRGGRGSGMPRTSRRRGTSPRSAGT